MIIGEGWNVDGLETLGKNLWFRMLEIHIYSQTDISQISKSGHWGFLPVASLGAAPWDSVHEYHQQNLWQGKSLADSQRRLRKEDVWLPAENKKLLSMHIQKLIAHSTNPSTPYFAVVPPARHPGGHSHGLLQGHKAPMDCMAKVPWPLSILTKVNNWSTVHPESEVQYQLESLFQRTGIHFPRETEQHYPWTT